MCRAMCVLVITLFVGLAHSWDIAISVGDRLEFYNDFGIKRATVQLTSHNMTALAYDEVHNKLLFVDKGNDSDAICGYDMTSVEYECFVERNGRNIQGLAFDPVTETLFFTDTKEKSINWFSFKPESKNNVNGNLLIKMDDGVPTDIAVDSCGGFIYWINTNLREPRTSTIERARFDGSEREVVINAEYRWNLHSLAIDQQKKKIYWNMFESRLHSHTYSADLNGKNAVSLVDWAANPSTILTNINPNSYSVSKQNLYVVAMVAWCSSCSQDSVWKFQKKSIRYDFNKMFEVHSAGVIGIAANYKMEDLFQEISDCNHVLNNGTDDSLKIGTEYEGPYCVHGTKVNGESLCTCTLGYTGERCEVSACENYCLQGNCSFTDQGLPKCRCEAGYSGERCEVNVCYGYCSNNGTCSLMEEDVPVCECVGEYEGERCEVPVALNNGDGSLHKKETGCHCVGSPEASGRETDNNKTITSTSRFYSPKRNLTLADLLANWQKPVAIISVFVEVKPNN